MTIDITLKQLIESIEKLIKMMEHDPECRVIDLFQDILDKAKLLSQSQPIIKEDLVDLSHSITSIFQGGMGAFNDYSPSIYNPSNGECVSIPEAEGFENVRSEVYSLALELRVKRRY